MGHGMEQEGDLATFVAVKEGGWHQLGTVEEGPLSVEQGLVKAHLADLDYHMEPVAVPVGDPPRFQRAEGQWASVRRNPFNRDKWDILGVGLSDQYVLHTPEQVFTLGEEIIAQGHPLSALGSINGGRRAFASFSLEGITIGGFDQIDMFLNALTDFTGGGATLYRVSGIRTVCANTFNAVMRQYELPTYRVRHTGTELSNRVDEARSALDVGWTAMAEFQREAEAFLAREVTASEFDRIVEALIPTPDSLGDRAKANRLDEREAVRHLYEDSDTVAPIRGTAWGILNSFTEWADWTSGQYADPSQRMVAQITPGSRIDNARVRAGSVIASVLSMSV